jgi:hypothetical protein
MKKPKVHVVLFLENDDMYNTVWYTSTDKKVLNDIRKELDTNGYVWKKKEYPLIMKCVERSWPEYLRIILFLGLW